MKKQHGSGLIFAVVLLFVILAMVVTLSSVTVLETKMSQKSKSSVGAFYNSESGVEWALNQIASATGPNISDAFSGFVGNSYACPANFNCSVYFLDQDGKVIISNLTLDQVKAVRSVGTQTAGDTTSRAIEAAVAAGSGTYVVWGTRTCPQGSPVYTGTMIYPSAGVTQGTSVGGVVCDSDISGWSSFSGQFWSSGGHQYSGELSCAVCAL